jgi:cobyrinic acid a,c-diamide synthase
MVAGTHSGAGKTTVTLVLLAALRRANYRAQPFKLGPDFIDPGYHREVAGANSINLDSWMTGLASVRASFARHCAGSDVAVIESMGGLFDGAAGPRDDRSAAGLARRLRAPVVLVVDIWGMTRSAHAVLNGFMEFDPRLRIAGFVLNRAGSHRHAEMVVESLPARLRKRCLGYVLRSGGLAIPERHLGLLTTEENALGPEWRSALEEAGRTLDLGALARIFGLVRRSGRSDPAPARRDARARIAVARDAAFCFYYPENLEMLEKAGAELCYFSPIRDARLPADVGGVYLGGGYPESFASELAANVRMKEAIAGAAAGGMPVYAECGGLMYLGRALQTGDGASHPMAGVFPLEFVMDRNHLAIRYADVRTALPTLLGPRGTTARGHEFHQSRLIGTLRPQAYRAKTSDGRAFRDGFVTRNVLASYIHLHFGSNPSIARRFVEACSVGSASPRPAERAPRRDPGRSRRRRAASAIS